MSGSLQLWPQQASGHAAQLDTFIMAFTVFVALLVIPVGVLVFVFAVKYRRGKTVDRQHAPNRKVWLEVSWSVVPFLAALGFYVWSTSLFFELRNPPSDTLDIFIVAKQWMWKAQHPGGQREIDELHIPVGQPVRLVMNSQDVIHSFYVPALRVKQDVVPGRVSSLWFKADKPGVYWMTCAEFCGTDHSVMGGRFYVQTADEYAAWLSSSGVDQSLVASGEVLFRKYGCSGCHAASSAVHAPDLAGLYGRAVALASGETVIADEQYIQDSILLPQKQIAAGYEPIMPTFKNILRDDEVIQLVAYIKSLRPASWRVK
ncbi:cytochrome c oxidase subunit II [Microvirga sp. 17 mud 1-3]|uniref:cytochrome c oxidase subunit II n=1 Tax=Microvirga sp. 17 mud 1-3 TaxID=2082949 RepID=UPI000D6B1FC3|nr:cytochrome c oxidase subunit II [Microvirga sp. 17 mud 1-3]AWM85928.1 cytochrome c oxidase subunit II [Microvirga sp. 17 mud 1-3]